MIHKLGYFGLESNESFGDCVLMFIPKIELVAKQVERLTAGLDLI